MSAQLIVTRVNVFLEEAGAQWATTDDIYAKLSIVTDDVENHLQALDLNFDTQVVTLGNVAKNTTSLKAFQADDQQLAGLVLPKVVEWKPAGAPESEYQEVPLVDKVIDTNTGSGVGNAAVAATEAVVASYEWRAGVVFISPCSVNVDLRIRFQGLPTLLNADSPYQPARGLTNPLAYLTAAMILALRGGKGALSTADVLEKKGLRALATFETQQVKASNAKGKRLGGRRPGRSGGDQWNGNFRGPLG